MRKNRMNSLLVAGGLMLAASGASAAVLPSFNGPLYFDYTGVEQVTPTGTINGANGATFNESNWGIIQVGNIYTASSTAANKLLQKSGSEALWSAGGGSGQILGIFYGINLIDAYGNGIGGQLDLYWVPVADFNMAAFTNSSPTSRLTAIDQFQGITDVAGSVKLASLAFTTGVAGYNKVNHDIITVSGGGVDPSAGESGTASSYLNATPGSGNWADAANSDWFHYNLSGKSLAAPPSGYYSGFADLYSTNNFAPITTYDINNNLLNKSAWDDDSTGAFGMQISNGSVVLNLATATDSVVADTVPEPGTLASLSLGLAALSFALRRRKLS